MSPRDPLLTRTDAQPPQAVPTGSRSAEPITLKQIAAFLTVVEMRSITRAAQRLHVSQSGLSRVISNVESVVGERLFVRTPSGLTLSPAGAALLPYAHRVQASHEGAMAAIATEASHANEITVACTDLVFPMVLPELMAVAAQSNPAGATWRVIGMKSFQVVNHVENGLADLGLCMNVEVGPSLRMIPVLTAPLGVLSDTRMPLPAQIRSLSALDGIRMARLSDDNMLPQLLDDRRQSLGAYFDANLVANSMGSLFAAVKSGQVATIVSAIAASLPEAADLRFTPLRDLLPSVQLRIVARRDSSFARLEAAPIAQMLQAIHQINWSAAVARDLQAPAHGIAAA